MKGKIFGTQFDLHLRLQGIAPLSASESEKWKWNEGERKFKALQKGHHTAVYLQYNFNTIQSTWDQDLGLCPISHRSRENICWNMLKSSQVPQVVFYVHHFGPTPGPLDPFRTSSFRQLLRGDLLRCDDLLAESGLHQDFSGENLGGKVFPWNHWRFYWYWRLIGGFIEGFIGNFIGGWLMFLGGLLAVLLEVLLDVSWYETDWMIVFKLTWCGCWQLGMIITPWSTWWNQQNEDWNSKRLYRGDQTTPPNDVISEAQLWRSW